MLASVCICLSASMCLHLSPGAARSPGRILAMSPCCWIAGPHARQRVYLLVSQYRHSCGAQCCQIAGPPSCHLPALPDCRAAFSPAGALLVSQHAPSFAFSPSPRAAGLPVRKSVPRWRKSAQRWHIIVVPVGAQGCSCRRTRVSLVGA